MVLSALVCFGLLPGAKAAGGNTAEGDLALASITTGIYNSAFGFYAALSISDQSFDTAIGAGALLLDTAGTNTAVGAGALLVTAPGRLTMQSGPSRSLTTSRENSTTRMVATVC